MASRLVLMPSLQHRWHSELNLLRLPDGGYWHFFHVLDELFFVGFGGENHQDIPVAAITGAGCKSDHIRLLPAWVFVTRLNECVPKLDDT
jgi:hypothetical protein